MLNSRRQTTPAERWPSGLRRTLGKRVYFNEYRGFESHSLRQIFSYPVDSKHKPLKICNLKIFTAETCVTIVLSNCLNFAQKPYHGEFTVTRTFACGRDQVRCPSYDRTEMRWRSSQSMGVLILGWSKGCLLPESADAALKFAAVRVGPEKACRGRVRSCTRFAGNPEVTLVFACWRRRVSENRVLSG
jgi:hypothetical protein